MMRRTLVVACATVAVALFAPSGASATSAAHIVRISGGDRYETAARVQLAAYTTSTVAVVASGENFPDALAAARLGFPILLTARDSLPEPTRDALQKLEV